MTSSSANKDLRKLSDLAGFELHVTGHCFRHLVAQSLYFAGELSRWRGHMSSSG